MSEKSQEGKIEKIRRHAGNFWRHAGILFAYWKFILGLVLTSFVFVYWLHLLRSKKCDPSGWIAAASLTQNSGKILNVLLVFTISLKRST